MKKTMVRSLFLCASLLFVYAFSPAPSTVYSEFFSDDYGAPKQLVLILGESKVLSVSNPKRLAIGDPEVADVVGAGSTELIISGKAPGETNLQLWDDYGRREIAVKVYEEDLAKLKDRLEALFATAGLRSVKFQIGEQERKVFVLGSLPDRKKDVVEQLLKNFEEKIINLVTYTDNKPVVEVDVQILEIQKAAIDKLGINWTSSLSFTESPVPSAHTLNRHVGDLLKSVWQSQFDRTSLVATLNVLEQDNLARTLARPKLVALSGSEAEFLVGGEVPIISNVSVSSGTTTTSVEYVEYGIKLNMKPEVKETGEVLCGLEVEVKSIDSATALAIPTGAAISTSTPGFKTRHATTELLLNNEQTVFLAGLINNEESNNIQSLPSLGNLPIIGPLFRSKDFQLGDTELVISITPKIVSYGDFRKDINSASGKAGDEEMDPAEAYVRKVQEMILGNVAYPLEAQRMNLSGSVVLSLHLLASGQLVDVMISDSSGHKMLDNAAIFTVKRLVPYPAFPQDLLLKEIWVEVPITYQLN